MAGAVNGELLQFKFERPWPAVTDPQRYADHALARSRGLSLSVAFDECCGLLFSRLWS
jgi:hypothetical protein